MEKIQKIFLMKATKVIINSFKFGSDALRKISFICETNYDEYLNLSKSIERKFNGWRKPFYYYDDETNGILIVETSTTDSLISIRDLKEVLRNDALAIIFSASEVRIKKTLGLLRIEIDTTSAKIILN